MTQLNVLAWEKPPPPSREGTPGRRTSQWDGVAAELREMSGIWGLIYDGPLQRVAALCSSIRAGHYRCFEPAGAFEAVLRKHGKDAKVYARFVGDDGEDEQ